MLILALEKLGVHIIFARIVAIYMSEADEDQMYVTHQSLYAEHLFA